MQANFVSPARGQDVIALAGGPQPRRGRQRKPSDCQIPDLSPLSIRPDKALPSALIDEPLKTLSDCLASRQRRPNSSHAGALAKKFAYAGVYGKILPAALTF